MNTNTITALIASIAAGIGTVVAVITYSHERSKEERAAWVQRNRQELETAEMFRLLRDGQRANHDQLSAICDELASLRSVAESLVTVLLPAGGLDIIRTALRNGGESNHKEK